MVLNVHLCLASAHVIYSCKQTSSLFMSFLGIQITHVSRPTIEMHTGPCISISHMYKGPNNNYSHSHKCFTKCKLIKGIKVKDMIF